MDKEMQRPNHYFESQDSLKNGTTKQESVGNELVL